MLAPIGLGCVVPRQNEQNFADWIDASKEGFQQRCNSRSLDLMETKKCEPSRELFLESKMQDGVLLEYLKLREFAGSCKLQDVGLGWVEGLV
jgi:hypothetical protein